MKISEIIKDGTINSKGILNIEQLISENEELRKVNEKQKDSFAMCIYDAWSSGYKYSYYTRKELKDEIIKINGLLNDENKDLREKHKTLQDNLAKINDLISNKRKVKTKDILSIIK